MRIVTVHSGEIVRLATEIGSECELIKKAERLIRNKRKFCMADDNKVGDVSIVSAARKCFSFAPLHSSNAEDTSGDGCNLRLRVVGWLNCDPVGDDRPTARAKIFPPFPPFRTASCTGPDAAACPQVASRWDHVRRSAEHQNVRAARSEIRRAHEIVKLPEPGSWCLEIARYFLYFHHFLPRCQKSFHYDSMSLSTG